MDGKNTAGKTSRYGPGDASAASRAAADRLARMTARRAGPDARDRAAREIVAIVARTGYLGQLVAERVPGCEAIRYEAGCVASDRGWPAGLATGVKEVLTGDLHGFRAEVTACLTEELTRLAPSLMNVDLIAGNGEGEPVSACAWAAGLIRSRHSGVWKTAVRQAVRAAKPTGGLLPPDLPHRAGSNYAPTRIEYAATFRPLWRGYPPGDGPAAQGLTEQEDSRTDDVCDSMKRQPGEYRLHLGAYQMTELLRTPPVARADSPGLFSLVESRAGQEAVREALRRLAGEDGAPSGQVDEDGLRRAFGHWTVQDLKAVTAHDGALNVIRILVSASVSRVRAMRDTDARACAPALMAALRARLADPDRNAFEEAAAGWSPARTVSFALAVNSAFHEPRGERQRERAAKYPPEALAAEAGVSTDVLEAAAYEVLVRRLLDSVPAGKPDAPAVRAAAA
jgi:hypothetical protein